MAAWMWDEAGARARVVLHNSWLNCDRPSLVRLLPTSGNTSDTHATFWYQTTTKECVRVIWAYIRCLWPFIPFATFTAAVPTFPLTQPKNPWDHTMNKLYTTLHVVWFLDNSLLLLGNYMKVKRISLFAQSIIITITKRIFNIFSFHFWFRARFYGLAFCHDQFQIGYFQIIDSPDLFSQKFTDCI